MTSFKHDCVQHRIVTACDCGRTLSFPDVGVSDHRCECGAFWSFDAETRRMRVVEPVTGKPTFSIGYIDDEEWQRLKAGPHCTVIGSPTFSFRPEDAVYIPIDRSDQIE